MNAQQKNYTIGTLASLFVHLVLLCFLFLLLTHKPQILPSSETKRTLTISQFNSEEQTPETPQQQSTPPAKHAEKHTHKSPSPQQETPKQAPIPTKKIVPLQKSHEQNQTQKAIKQLPMPPQKAQQKPKEAKEHSPGSSLLSALNSQFKHKKQEVGSPIRKLYGDEFDKLSPEQQKFIRDNLGSIGRITERYLRYPDIAGKTGQQGTNIVEFNLHPNGDISEVKLLNGSGYHTLDRNSVETIELAYKDYPRPSVTTKIRIYVTYTID